MRESTGDIVDQAADIQEHFLEQARTEQARKMGTAPEDFDGKHCTECGAGIVAGRLALGRWTCIECQEVLERNSKLYKG